MKIILHWHTFIFSFRYFITNEHILNAWINIWTTIFAHDWGTYILEEWQYHCLFFLCPQVKTFNISDCLFLSFISAFHVRIHLNFSRGVVGQRNNFVFRRAGCLFSSLFNWQIIVCRRTRFFKIVRRDEWATLPMKYHAYGYS